MKRQNVFKTIKILASLIGVFILVFVVYKTSYSLLSNSLRDSIGIDEKTSKYISFNYSSNDKYLIEIDNPRVISDFNGKRMLGNNYYDFEIMVPNNIDEKIEYEIILTPMSFEIDSRFIKIYLTDQDNKEVEGYDDVVPVLSVFPEVSEGKIIYTGEIVDGKSDKYRLRIWVNSDYSEEINNILAYQLQVKVK